VQQTSAPQAPCSAPNRAFVRLRLPLLKPLQRLENAQVAQERRERLAMEAAPSAALNGTSR